MFGSLRLGDDAPTRLIHGACGVARAVKVTLGPRGRHVLIETASGPPRVTKRGATIAASVGFDDRYSEMGAALMREITRGTIETSGDGATTAATIAHSLLIDGFAAIAAGLAPLALGAEIEATIARALEAIKTSIWQAEDPETLRHVAKIAANGDEKIGNSVSEELRAVGPDGLVLIEDGKKTDDTIEHGQGMQFDQGFASRAFIDASAGEIGDLRQSIELVRPLILLCDGIIDRLDPWLAVLDAALVAKRPLLILASQFGSDALAMLAASRERGGLKVVPVTCPGYAGRRTDFLGDLGALIGCNVLTALEFGGHRSLDDHDLGRAERVRVSAGRTTIIGGSGSRDAIDARCRWLRSAAASAADPHDRDVLRRRLARLASGISTIRVGGGSEPERQERRERFESALNATRSAAADGVAPGGGVALYRAAQVARGGACTTAEARAGRDIVVRALKEPLRQIVANAGIKPAEVGGQLEAVDDRHMGFDAERLECGNVVTRGILDSAATVTTALRRAGSISALVLTSGNIILERSEKSLARHPFACRCSEHDRTPVPEDPFRARHGPASAGRLGTDKRRM